MIFDLKTAPMNTTHGDGTMTLLSNGKALVAGGVDPSYQALANAELFGSVTAAR